MNSRGLQGDVYPALVSFRIAFQPGFLTKEGERDLRVYGWLTTPSLWSAKLLNN